MAEWSDEFETVLTSLKAETLIGGGRHNVMHVLIQSWMSEDDAMVWITKVPGQNMFGSQVLFVNDKVLSKLQWNFDEWEDGTASQSIFTNEEAAIVKLHLDAKSILPVAAHVRRKNLPQNQTGDHFVFYFHYDLPHDLRLTVAVPG